MMLARHVEVDDNGLSKLTVAALREANEALSVGGR